MLSFLKKSPLTREQRAFWDDNGYLILPKLFSEAEIDAVNAEIAEITGPNKTKYPNVTVDVISGRLNGQRLRLPEVPDDAYAGPVKINDLYLESPTVRALPLGDRLLDILHELLDGDAMICNSLNFIYGSQQAAHYDSWFMPPNVKDKMAVASICLDAYTEANGPLFVYPGSHKIPPYRFSHGGINAIKEELPAASTYVAETTRDIEKVFFYGEPGDVLIWHSQLLHGGAPMQDPQATRRSLVTHYWRAQDVVGTQRAVKLVKHGYMLEREHQAVA